MNKWAMAACCALALVSASAGAEIYKWKDKAGRVQYSDVPPPGNIPYTTLSGRKSPEPPPAATEAKPAQVPQAAPAGADAEAKKKAAEEQAAKDAEIRRLQEEKQAAEKRVREENCKNARARAAQFQQGGRIYRIDEAGERQYYGDAEIAAELERARADVDTYCSE